MVRTPLLPLVAALAACSMHVSTPADIQIALPTASLVQSIAARPTPPPPLVPESSLLPAAPSVPPPPLEGLRERIDLRTLETTSVTYTLPVRVDSLAAVTRDHHDTLLRHLAADPRWRVDRVEGRWVASLRGASGSRWTLPTHGYHLADAQSWRASLRFDDLPASDAWSRSSFVTHVGATQKQVKLSAFVLQPPPYHGLTATALSVEGGGATLDVFEASSDDEGRPFTSATLSEVHLYVDGLLRSAREVSAKGYDPLSMPRGEPAISSSVGVQLVGHGEIDVYGRVNAGEPGWTWVRIVDGAGRPWQEATLSAATREWVGSSGAAAEQFYFQGRAPVPGGPAFDATAQVWFQSFDGGAPRLLLERGLRVPAR